MAWSVTSPWSKAPDSSTSQKAHNALPACLQFKDVTHKPSEVEKGASDAPIAMKDNDDTSPHTPKSPMNNAFTSSAQTLVHGPEVVDRRSQDSHRSEEDRGREDTVAELPTTIPAGSRPWLRESKLPARPRDSTNPYALPGKKPQYPDDDHRQSFDDIPLSGQQENFDPACHDRGGLPLKDSMHKASNTDDCGVPYPLADSMPILSPDPYGKDFDKYEHAPTPDQETFPRSPTPPPKPRAPLSLDSRIPPSADNDYKHKRDNTDTHRRPSGDSMPKDSHNPHYSTPDIRGTYMPPACTGIPLQQKQPAYAEAPRGFSADVEIQKEGRQREMRRQGLWSWKFWKAGWWTVERVLLVWIVLMSFFIFVLLLGKK